MLKCVFIVCLVFFFTNGYSLETLSHLNNISIVIYITIILQISHFPIICFAPRDDTPHVPNEDLGEDEVISIIRNLTNIITEVFPSMCEVNRHNIRG